MKKDPVIQLDQVNFAYDHLPVIEDATFSIYEKDYIAVIGPNGGGKSTLIKIILGLLAPDNGKVHLFGGDCKKQCVNVGYVPQHFEFDFDFPMTVIDVVLMGRLGHAKPGHSFSDHDKHICMDALEKVGMQEYADAQIDKLSGGQRQRVLVARALATQPKVLVLDEPTSGIDIRWQEKFHELIEELNKELTIIIISHHLDIICSHVNKVLFVNREVHMHEDLKEAVSHIGELYGFPDTFTLKNICM